MTNVVTETSINDVSLVGKGKVRDIYDTGDAYLMVTTDRISAFDVILADAIPGKGKVLNQVSIFWYEKMKDIVDNHLITADVNQYPHPLQQYGDILEGRSMLVKKAKPLPVECIVRGYLSGSGWKSYQKEGHVCGIELPDGLRESDRLPEPLYTPSTKAEAGLHDENISYEKTVELMGAETAEKVKRLSLDIYKRGAEIALEKGIIIADTKFEFGIVDDGIVLIDEVLTPDSSRFWPKKEYEPGKSQKSYDKQYVRDWLLQSGWDKTPPGPKLPEEVIRNTADTYREIFDLLTDGGK